MTGVLLAGLSAWGAYLLITSGRARTTDRSAGLSALLLRCRAASVTALGRAGVDGVSPARFLGLMVVTGVAAGLVGTLVFGPGLPALIIGGSGAATPVAVVRHRRAVTRRVAEEAWPRLIEELRVLTGSVGRPVPQALLEVGLRGPQEMRHAFEAAQREWALSTDFGRTVSVLKERLADATADAACETLLVAHEVGGDLDARLQALAEDRRVDLRDRQEARAKQAGARLARGFVVLVPAGMALAGLSVGDGRDAYRTSLGQLLVGAGVLLVAVCWWWASRIMWLPDDERVFTG